MVISNLLFIYLYYKGLGDTKEAMSFLPIHSGLFVLKTGKKHWYT